VNVVTASIEIKEAGDEDDIVLAGGVASATISLDGWIRPEGQELPGAPFEIELSNKPEGGDVLFSLDGVTFSATIDVPILDTATEAQFYVNGDPDHISTAKDDTVILASGPLSGEEKLTVLQVEIEINEEGEGDDIVGVGSETPCTVQIVGASGPIDIGTNATEHIYLTNEPGGGDVIFVRSDGEYADHRILDVPVQGDSVEFKVVGNPASFGPGEEETVILAYANDPSGDLLATEDVGLFWVEVQINGPGPEDDILFIKEKIIGSDGSPLPVEATPGKVAFHDWYGTGPVNFVIQAPSEPNLTFSLYEDGIFSATVPVTLQPGDTQDFYVRCVALDPENPNATVSQEMGDKDIEVSVPEQGNATAGRKAYTEARLNITIGTQDPFAPEWWQDPGVPDAWEYENSGEYIIIVNNDFDESQTDLGMKQGLLGNTEYSEPVTDLDARYDIKPNDGEVRRMLVTLYGPEGLTGQIRFTTFSLLPDMSTATETKPLLSIWYHDTESERIDGPRWITLGTRHELPEGSSRPDLPEGYYGHTSYISIKIPEGENSGEVLVYLEAYAPPDFWDKDYDNKAYYHREQDGTLQFVKEVVGTHFVVDDNTMATATAVLQVADVKHYYLQSTHTYGHEGLDWVGHSAAYFWGLSIPPPEISGSLVLSKAEFRDQVYDYVPLLGYDNAQGIARGFRDHVLVTVDNAFWHKDLTRPLTYELWKYNSPNPKEDVGIVPSGDGGEWVAINSGEESEARIKAARLAFTYDDVLWLDNKFDTYAEFQRFSFKPEGNDANCAYALAKVYDTHAAWQESQRKLNLPSGLLIKWLGPRYWGQYAMGDKDTWLEKNNWVVGDTWQEKLTKPTT